MLPLLFLALFGAIFAGSQENLDVIVPGIAGMSIMTTTFNALAMNVVFLREQGVLKRLRGTPLPSSVNSTTWRRRNCSGRSRPSRPIREPGRSSLWNHCRRPRPCRPPPRSDRRWTR